MARVTIRAAEMRIVADACDFLAQTCDDIIQRDFQLGGEPEEGVVADAVALSAVYHRLTGENTTFGKRLDWMGLSVKAKYGTLIGALFGDGSQTLKDAYAP